MKTAARRASRRLIDAHRAGRAPPRSHRRHRPRRRTSARARRRRAPAPPTDLGQHAAVRDDELQLGPGATVLELDAETPASLAQPGSVDRLRPRGARSRSARPRSRAPSRPLPGRELDSRAGQRRQPRTGLLEERRRVLAAAELVAVEDLPQHVARRRDADDLELAQRAAGPLDRQAAVAVDDDQLRDQRVVVRRDRRCRPRRRCRRGRRGRAAAGSARSARAPGRSRARDPRR